MDDKKQRVGVYLPEANIDFLIELRIVQSYLEKLVVLQLVYKFPAFY